MELNYKNLCILGYILAALGSIVPALIEFGYINEKPSKTFYVAYLIGGIITAHCAFNWLFHNK
jgi:hypothetical protein